MTVKHDGTLVGVNPANGDLLWMHKAITGRSALPAAFDAGNRTLVVVPTVLPQKKKKKGKEQQAEEEMWLEGIYAFDVKTGEQVWYSDALGHSPLGVRIIGDVAIGNGKRSLKGKIKKSALSIALAQPS